MICFLRWWKDCRAIGSRLVTCARESTSTAGDRRCIRIPLTWSGLIWRSTRSELLHCLTRACPWEWKPKTTWPNWWLLLLVSCPLQHQYLNKDKGAIHILNLIHCRSSTGHPLANHQCSSAFPIRMSTNALFPYKHYEFCVRIQFCICISLYRLEPCG